jgi:hypothetical protein
MYGDANHFLRFESTAPFFNNSSRGRTLGHFIQNNRLNENTVALDSWLSLGAASNQRFGIPKVLDPDGSTVGGTFNDGGSASIPGGLLTHFTPEMEVALTVADGLIPTGGAPALPPGFVAVGTSSFDAVFGENTTSGTFAAGNVVLRTNEGVQGTTADNILLLAQLTTAGELSFEINLEIRGTDGVVRKYVGKSENLQTGEIPNGLLQYPRPCGCTNPNYLEFDPTSTCDDGSCETLAVLGCADPAACNFQPTANINVPALCCYGPGNCNGLDINVVCPTLQVDEEIAHAALRVFPNPAMHQLFMERDPATAVQSQYYMFNALGSIAAEGLLRQGETRTELSMAHLPQGIYLLVVISPHGRTTRQIAKL